MQNTAAVASSWVEFLSSRPEVPFHARLRSHFGAGTISRLCDCGCHSFDLTIPEGVVLSPLCEPGRAGGKFFELVCESTEGSEIAFLFFADSRGYLSGIDVTAGSGNHAPLPSKVEIGKVLYAL
jgi:hypothetical protein